MEEYLKKGPENLKQEVIQSGWCVSCGVCADLCPYIKTVEDRIAVVHSCGIEEGSCYKVCPRTATDYAYLHNQVRGRDDYEPVLGGYHEICIARAVETRHGDPGQYGGVVTALVSHALREGMVDASLLTSNSGSNRPEFLVARSEEEVIRSAGSKYMVYPGVSGLYRQMREEQNTLIVGRPCQVTGLRKLQHYTDRTQGKSLKLLIGLFCFWGLDYDFYNYLEDEMGVSTFTRIDIPRDRGPVLDTPGGKVEIPLEKVRSFIKRGCHSCFDPTSELADLSVGSTESDPRWCTVIVRTDAGSALLRDAVSRGLIETGPYPLELETGLRGAVKTKKLRVLRGEHELAEINSSYIRLSEALQEQLKGGDQS